ncbi:MAG TPA: HNH endonuclease signature motif containing protein [Candidatus Paceibacterota bacterium]|nr:HNH endonuclease signature motif containing protein [Candidatus Paceibacterota bacterium]
MKKETIKIKELGLESLTGHKRSLEEIRNMSKSRKGVSVKHEGQFKKGYTPWNKKDKKDKRKFIRINGNVVLKSRYVWANYHNQDIPIGFVIHHIDENPENDDINNLRLMRKQDHNFLHQMIDRERFRNKNKVEKLKGYAEEEENKQLIKTLDEIFGEFK